MSSLGSILISSFDYVDFTFAENDELFELVNTKKLDFAIVTKQYDTFDTIHKKIGQIKLILVGATTIDTSVFKEEIKIKNLTVIENWLKQQKWYSYDARIPHIKLFWMYVFNKKRPSIVANYIIPSEYEMLQILAKNKGVAIVWDCNAQNLLKDKKIQLLWDSDDMPSSTVYLLSGKKESLTSVFNELQTKLQDELQKLFEV